MIFVRVDESISRPDSVDLVRCFSAMLCTSLSGLVKSHVLLAVVNTLAPLGSFTSLRNLHKHGSSGFIILMW